MDNDHVTRRYRSLHTTGNLRYFNVQVKDSDLAIGVNSDSYTDSLIPLCRKELVKLRSELEDYIVRQPEFKLSFVPIVLLPEAPKIAVQMAEAAWKAGTGPMAAVAGAFAQVIGERLHERVNDVIVENGGDIYINSSRERTVAIYAGKSKFSYKIGLILSAEETPLGICTSSGTVGPSISYGKADAIVVKSNSAALADAVATQAGNLVKTEDDLVKAIKYAGNIDGIKGIIAIKSDKMAVWGEMEIVPIARGDSDESSR